jgi:hypothetical protein
MKRLKRLLDNFVFRLSAHILGVVVGLLALGCLAGLLTGGIKL